MHCVRCFTFYLAAALAVFLALIFPSPDAMKSLIVEQTSEMKNRFHFRESDDIEAVLRFISSVSACDKSVASFVESLFAKLISSL
jgi:hypothetical protein